eukprot:861937-Amphidinium_carterae.1
MYHHHHRPESSPKQKDERTEITKNTNVNFYIISVCLVLEVWGDGTIFGPDGLEVKVAWVNI